MKVYSAEQLPTYQVSGQELRVHWNAKEITSEGMEGPVTQWEQDEALCSVADSYGQLVAKIIGSVYDYNAELAAINDGGEKYAEYQAFRTQAKDLAKGWINK